MAKTGNFLSASLLADAPQCDTWSDPARLQQGRQPPTSLVPQVLCALVAHDDSKQRWLQSAGVLQLLERLLQSNSAGPEASDELSLYLVSLLLSPSGCS